MSLFFSLLAISHVISIPIMVLILLIAMAFLFYGYNCLFSEKMTEEFNRFGLNTAQRKTTGVAQIIGALGLIGGCFYWPLGLAASAGLTLLMLLGFGVRLKIKDSFAESAPSFILMLINGYFAYYFGMLLELW